MKDPLAAPMKMIGICMGLQASTIAGVAVARRAVITMVKIFILIRVGRDGVFWGFLCMERVEWYCGYVQNIF